VDAGQHSTATVQVLALPSTPFNPQPEALNLKPQPAALGLRVLALNPKPKHEDLNLKNHYMKPQTFLGLGSRVR
jgi:hypothetical protein